MFYVCGESIDGEPYDFVSISRTLNEVHDECRELLETLDGGFFDIYRITKSGKEYIDSIDW